MRRRVRTEHGAAAVEFALVASLLVTLLLGIMEFGWAFYHQSMLAGAAREAARDFAIRSDTALARQAAQHAVGPGMAITVTFDVDNCATAPTNTPVTATVTHDYTSLTGIIGGFEMRGKGTMRCNG